VSSEKLRRSRVGPAQGRIADWFREFRTPLRKFIARRRSLAPCDLDDVAQEVFLRLLRYDRTELVLDPKNYLFQMAANVSREWSLRARHRMPHDSSWLDGLLDTADVAAETESAERAMALQAAMETLSARAREVMRLHFSEGLTHAAISSRLNLSQRIVKREIVNGCMQLRARLLRTGGRLP
jgi:RNA polymerase sigma factor (sigma-70 family)